VAAGNGGRGVIYRMVDEFSNDVPYDFKSIQFLPHNVSDSTYRYTFDTDDRTDGSLLGLQREIYGNTIKPYFNDRRWSLPRIVFQGDICYNNTFGESCHNNTFGAYCTYNTFGVYCSNNTFSKSCHNNTFGDYCDNNTLGYDCSHNTFGAYCTNNTFGGYCYDITFGHGCGDNTLGRECGNNTLEHDCVSNTFGDYCSHNTFGAYGNYNTFGHDCGNNTLGHDCGSNTFGDYCDGNRVADYWSGHDVGDDWSHNVIDGKYEDFVTYDISDTGAFTAISPFRRNITTVVSGQENFTVWVNDSAIEYYYANDTLWVVDCSDVADAGYLPTITWGNSNQTFHPANDDTSNLTLKEGMTCVFFITEVVNSGTNDRHFIVSRQVIDAPVGLGSGSGSGSWYDSGSSY
jgi:hypothetical protein